MLVYSISVNEAFKSRKLIALRMGEQVKFACWKGIRGVGLGNHNENSSKSQKPYRCTFRDCQKKFRRPDHRKRHERTHAGEKPYICQYCPEPKAFSRLDNLRAHKKLHFDSSNKNRRTLFVPEAAEDLGEALQTCSKPRVTPVETLGSPAPIESKSNFEYWMDIWTYDDDINQGCANESFAQFLGWDSLWE